MNYLVIILIILTFGIITNAQTITDTRENGSWVFSLGNGMLDHFKVIHKFPPEIITTDAATKKSVKLSPAIQSKMQNILQIFKDVYPKPYKESVTFGVRYLPANTGDSPLAYNIHLGDYGFTYDKLGKIKPINPASQLGNMYEGYGNIYVNYFPDSARTTISSEQGLKFKEKLSYFTQKPFEESERRIRPNGKIYALGPQNNFDEAMKYLDRDIKNYKLSEPNPPSAKFGNEADNFFTVRRLTANVSKENKTIYYVFSNFVVMSADNKLPLIPVSRREFLNLLEENLNEEAEVAKLNFEKYKGTNSGISPKLFEDNNKERKRKYDVVNLIREVYRNELDKPAVLSSEHINLAEAGFYHIFNRKNVPTAKEVNDVFIADKSVGQALYRFDNNFYKGLKQDDIKTIAFEWEEKLLNLPIAEKFPSADYKDKNGKLLTDVKFHRAIQHKLNWSKLASMLTK